MLHVYLSGSGSRVDIPDAVKCVDPGNTDQIDFIDASGRCIVRFNRPDVTIFATPAQAEAMQLIGALS